MAESAPPVGEAADHRLGDALEGILDQLRALKDVPGNLESALEALQKLQRRLDDPNLFSRDRRFSEEDLDFCGFGHTFSRHGTGGHDREGFADRHSLAKEAASRLVTAPAPPCTPGQQHMPPLIGGGAAPVAHVMTATVQAHETGRTSSDGGARTSGHTTSGHTSAHCSRFQSRIPSAVPSRVQSRFGSRRPSALLTGPVMDIIPSVGATPSAPTAAPLPVSLGAPPKFDVREERIRESMAGCSDGDSNEVEEIQSPLTDHGIDGPWSPEKTRSSERSRTSSRSDISAAGDLTSSQPSPGGAGPRRGQSFRLTQSNVDLGVKKKSGGGNLMMRPAASSDSLGSIASLKPQHVLMPNSALRLSVDVLTICAVLWTGLAIPVVLVYRLKRAADIGRVGLHIADAVWWLYIFINGITSVFLDGAWEFRARRIFVIYAKSWLLVDLAAAWPVALTPREGTLAWGLLLLKMVRLTRLGSLLSKLQKEYRHAHLWLVRVGLTFLLMENIACCIWRLAQATDQVTVDEGLEWWELYISDMYWLVMTLSTVGYGDIAPAGVIGRLYACLTMLVAPAFFGLIVSLLTQGMKKIFDDEVEIQVGQAIQFMERRSVPLSVQRRVENNFRHHIGQCYQMAAPDLFKNLSPAIQRDLSLELLRSTVLQFPLFSEAPRPFVAEISRAHTWVQCLPWDLVVEQGQLVQEVVFVIQGRVIMQCSCWSDTSYDMSVGQLEEHPEALQEELACEQELEVGAWFGEKCLFEEDRVRTATGIAAMESELAVLMSEEYHRIIQKYPPLLEQHKNIKEAVTAKRVQLVELEYMPEENDDGTQNEQAAKHRWSVFRREVQVAPK